MGRITWLYDGVTTQSIGLEGAEHTRSNGAQTSEFEQMNEGGHVRGYSLRYNGSSSNLGRSAWLYDGAATHNIGLSGSEYTRSDGYEYSRSEQMNQAGQVIGYSERFVDTSGIFCSKVPGSLTAPRPSKSVSSAPNIRAGGSQKQRGHRTERGRFRRRLLLTL